MDPKLGYSGLRKISFESSNLTKLFFYWIFRSRDFSVSRDFLPKHVNRHSKQSIYETNIFNFFNDFKEFLTIFNSSVDYNFVFSHSFKFYANFDDNLVIPECILTLYTLNLLLSCSNWSMFSLIILITKSFGKLLC